MSDEENAADALRAVLPGVAVDTRGSFAVAMWDDGTEAWFRRHIDARNGAPWGCRFVPCPGDDFNYQRGATPAEALRNARTVTSDRRRCEVAKLRREAAALDASADALDALRIVDAEVVK